MKKLTCIALLLALLMSGNCEDETAADPPKGSCQVDASDTGVSFCVTYPGSGYSYDNTVESCDEYKDVVTTSSYQTKDCDQAGTIGSCTLLEGTENELIWLFYTEETTGSAESNCTEAGGSWTAAL